MPDVEVRLEGGVITGHSAALRATELTGLADLRPADTGQPRELGWGTGSQAAELAAGHLTHSSVRLRAVEGPVLPALPPPH